MVIEGFDSPLLTNRLKTLPLNTGVYILRTIIGTVGLLEVSNSLRTDLAQVQSQIKNLVNSKPFAEHTRQDIADYVDMRNQESAIIDQLSGKRPRIIQKQMSVTDRTIKVLAQLYDRSFNEVQKLYYSKGQCVGAVKLHYKFNN